MPTVARTPPTVMLSLMPTGMPCKEAGTVASGDCCFLRAGLGQGLVAHEGDPGIDGGLEALGLGEGGLGQLNGGDPAVANHGGCFGD